MRTRLTLTALCVVGLGLSGLTACSRGAGHSAQAAGGTAAAGATGPTVQVSLSHCGAGWSGGVAGWQSFTIDETDSRAAEVTLVDPASGGVYASLEPLGAGRSAAMGVALGPGSYAFRCAMEDEDVVTGPTVRVTGSLPAGLTTVPPVRPVTQADLIGPTRAYTAYVAGRLPALLADTRRVGAAVARGDRRGAERDWLVAHLDYERLGAAYGAFGDADGAINGLPSGLPGGVRDPDFTGFHRLEFDLWHGAAPAQLRRDVAGLEQAMTQLRSTFATAQLDPLEVSIRAHEITENAVQFELTGRTDFGSHSSLATVQANLDGTRTVIGFLRPLLQPRYSGLPATMAALDRARTDLDKQHTSAGWVALQSLPRPARERVDSDLSQLTELLAPIASICEPRRTP